MTDVLEPIFERSFIFDSYACRRGKGTHAAVHRCQQFACRFRYVLKADIKKFFPSLDHEILQADPWKNRCSGKLRRSVRPQRLVAATTAGDAAVFG